MTYQLPNLPFKPEDLSALSSPETFEFHHGKHHAGYVKKLNDAAEGTEYEELDLEEAIKKSHELNNTSIYNNAAQHWNHSFFWNCLTNPEDSNLNGEIKTRIEKDFGSFQQFQDQFTMAACSLFGSGWAWLIENADQKLEIIQAANADNPLINDQKALLTIDVWEHAYYIDYRNARPEFVKKFWNVVNWNQVNENLK
ncbi:superoxide dismutase [Fe] [Candidatus Peregrinibacteria bacterium]|nr:superoxide dismutase [Fe] [Candidatus Peregrinibacteria bacterium]